MMLKHYSGDRLERINQLCENKNRRPDFVGRISCFREGYRMGSDTPNQRKVAEHIVMAREKDGIWYVGGLTDWNARDVEVDLSFLGKGEYKAEIFKDGINTDRVGKDYKHEVVRVSADKKLQLCMAPGGGFEIRITK